MKLLIATPVRQNLETGNHVTAVRWATLLQELGHEVEIIAEWTGQKIDGLIVLHANKGAASIRRFDAARSGQFLIVALTGTDVYGCTGSKSELEDSLQRADRLVVLQKEALESLPASARAKARVIHQSATAPKRAAVSPADGFLVCVLAHLRAVKDPLRVAHACGLLPPSSRLHALLFGGALEPALAAEARALQTVEPRFEWRGEVAREEALAALAQSHVLVNSSRLEGGANVISEAIVLGVPVMATRIAGSIGLLGGDYPGFFEVGDTEGLAGLLQRAETDIGFYDELRRRCDQKRPLFEPARELQSWKRLLAECTSMESPTCDT